MKEKQLIKLYKKRFTIENEKLKNMQVLRRSEFCLVACLP